MPYDRFVLAGGLDTNTPYISRQPGTLYDTVNHEPDIDGGGYRLMNGYERFDGNVAPSDVDMFVIELGAGESITDSLIGVPFEGVDGLRFRVGRAVNQAGGLGQLLYCDVLSRPTGGIASAIGTSTTSPAVRTLKDINAYLVENSDLTPANTGVYATLNYKCQVVPSIDLRAGGYSVQGQTSLTIAKVQNAVLLGAGVNSLITLYMYDADGEFLPYEELRVIFIPQNITFTAVTDYALVNPASIFPMEDYLNNPFTPQGMRWVMAERRRYQIRPAGYIPTGNPLTDKVFPLSGVWEHKNEAFVWYDNTLTGRTVMNHQTPGGWAPPTGSSGRTLILRDRPATVTDEMVESGVWVYGLTSGSGAFLGDLRGYYGFNHQGMFINVTATSGSGFVVGEDLEMQSVANPSLVIGKFVGLQSNDLPVGGRVRATSHNFTGIPNNDMLIYCNGLGYPVLYDGNASLVIYTGAEGVYPIAVTTHYEHLFFGYPASVMHSVVGDPLDWSGNLGALEIALGSNLTDMIESPQSLILGTEHNIQVLTGNGYDTWQKDIVTTHSGIAPFTGAYITQSFVLGRAGVIAIDRVSSFGNFGDAAITDKIRDLIQPLFSNASTAIGDKTKSQYRIFYRDGYGLICSVYQGQLQGIGAMRTKYGVYNVCNPNGDIFFTFNPNTDPVEDAAFVYQMDKGTSNDGELREFYLRTSYANQGDPDTRKAFRRATISVRNFALRQMRVNFEFSKGSGESPSSFIKSVIQGRNGRFGVDDWNTVYYDGADVPEIHSDMDGVGSDVSLSIYGQSLDATPYVLEDVTYEYQIRRKVR